MLCCGVERGLVSSSLSGVESGERERRRFVIVWLGGRVAALRLANESILFPQTAKNHECMLAPRAKIIIPQYRMISVRQE